MTGDVKLEPVPVECSDGNRAECFFASGQPELARAIFFSLGCK
jgi:hypothetical protein